MVEVNDKFHPDRGNYRVKDYPKDREPRRFKLSTQITTKLRDHIRLHAIAPGNPADVHGGGLGLGVGKEAEDGDQAPRGQQRNRTQPDARNAASPYVAFTTFTVNRMAPRYGR